MFRFRFAAGVVLAAVAILGLAGPVAAGDSVPFKGYLEGDVTRTPAPPIVKVDIDAEGRASHLGQFTLDIPHDVTPATRTAEGYYHFTAANGDKLTAEFTGKSTPIPDTTFLFIEENATIIGGTGRFAGANGEFKVYRLFDMATGTTIGCFEGSISRENGKE
jgi:hypothetical protein